MTAKGKAKRSILTVTKADVRSVYSGRPGCCCGCRGDHRYNSQHVKEASKHRGYRIEPTEVNDAQVTRVLNRLKDVARVDPTSIQYEATYASLEQYNRLLIVYFTNTAQGKG